MSSYPAPRITCFHLLFWPAILWLALSADARAASGVAVGNGSTASANLDFRIVIPGHLNLSLSEAVDGRATLDVELYSRRGTLSVNRGDTSEDSRLAGIGQGGIIKTTSLQTSSGVYTVASP